mgnify:CR=1 FL=1
MNVFDRLDATIPLDGEERMLLDSVKTLARERIAPRAEHYDRSAEFPWDNVKKMADLGLLGIPWSEELGGAGLDTICFMIAIEELARVCASHSIVVSAHTTLGTSPIVNFGNDAQRERYVPLLASGSVLGGFGLTEPGAGSDAGGTRTTAVKKGNHYQLNGSKRFITHAGVGEIFIVTAVTDPGKGTKGISSFVLTKETCDLERVRDLGIGHSAELVPMKGFRAGKKENKLGWRASDTRELLFEDVEVPAENLIGQEGQGFVNFMRTLDAGRIGIAFASPATQLSGVASTVYEEVAFGPMNLGLPRSEVIGRTGSPTIVPRVTGPVKRERASGLLTPQAGYSNQNGVLYRQPIFFDMDD